MAIISLCPEPRRAAASSRPLVPALALTGLLVAVSPVGAQTTAPAVGTLAPVMVDGLHDDPHAAPGRASITVGGFGATPVAETPQSISVIGAESLEERGARNLSQAIRLESSVDDHYNTVGYPESLRIRGFLLDSAGNYRRDGMSISNHAPAALENRERIEILKGLSGIQAGSSAPGGLVDHVLKRPTDEDLRAIEFGVSERSTTRLHADFGGRFDGGVIGYRINLAGEQLRPDADAADGQRRFVSGFFDARLPAGLLLEAEFEHHRFRQPSVPGFGLLDVDGDGFAEALPAPVDPSVNLGAQPWALPFESRSTVGSLRLSQRLDDWHWRLRWQRQRIATDDRLPFPDGCGSGPAYVYPGFCGNGDFDLYDFRTEGERRIMDVLDAGIGTTVHTGSVRHELGFGITRNRYRERPADAQAYNWVGTGNMFDPVVLPADSALTVTNTDADSYSRELYIHDAMQLNDRLSLWVGMRHTRLERSSVLTDRTETVSLEQSFTTPWAALGLKVGARGFAYVSAGEGVETESVPNRPQDYANYGQALEALVSMQFEIGWRQRLEDGGLFSITLFQIDKPFADDVEQADGSVLRVAGARKARHRGLALGWAGRLSSRLDARVQATWLDAKIRRSPDPSLVGGRTPNTAPLAAAARLSWRVPGVDGLSWSNQVQYSGRKAVFADRSVELGSWAQFDTDLALRRRIGNTFTIWRVGIDNLFDRRYWRDAPTQYWGAQYLFPARGRTLRLSVQAMY
ncbi:MAG: TonB-dependent siderophore receptor [Burkholderiaceae bacterium]